MQSGLTHPYIKAKRGLSIMNTSFSLTYLECAHSTVDILEELKGNTTLYSSYESALDALFMYVRDRLSDGLEDVFEDYMNSHEELEGFSFKEAMGFILNNFDEKEKLVDYYFNSMKSDNNHAEYSIKELPTESLIDQLILADAVEIDGNFIRHFNLPSPEDYSDNLLNNDLSSFFECELVDDEYKNIKYNFSVEALNDAVYCPVTKVWKVSGEFSVLPYRLSN